MIRYVMKNHKLLDMAPLAWYEVNLLLLSQIIGKDLLLGYLRICLVANFLCLLVSILTSGQGLGHSETENEEEVVEGLHQAAGQFELRIGRGRPVFILRKTIVLC